MSSAQVPLWVPIIVGALGFAGVISAQLIAGRREDRRWSREVEKDELRWERERVRERENRGHEERAAGYAELIGAIESLDFLLYEARQIVAEGKKLDDHIDTELRRVTAILRNTLGVVNLHAPERIRGMLRDSVLPRMSLSRTLLNDRDRAEHRPLWDTGQRAYRVLRAEMRRDLGLDTERLDTQGLDTEDTEDTEELGSGELGAAKL
jgi:hypothetical protein